MKIKAAISALKEKQAIISRTDDDHWLYEPIATVLEELEVYQKAYNLLSKAYCDKGECWSACECYEQCKTIDKKGVDVTKEFFLQKARKENG